MDFLNYRSFRERKLIRISFLSFIKFSFNFYLKWSTVHKKINKEN